jgi:arylsulfatase A-like enzyme
MNLVLLPLEGVSQTMFWQYREAMPRLWELSNRSAMFRRFYAASTSAFQSFCDVAYGDSFELDHNERYPSERGCVAGKGKNLFAELRRRGFEAFGVQHGGSCPAYVADNFRGAWPDECGAFEWHGGYAGFYGAIDEFLGRVKAASQPFVLYVSDRAALAGDASPEKRETALYHERFAKGFSLLDQTAGRVMDALAARGLLEGAIVVVYGPYGMDLWKHGISRGRATAIEPYADLCWTPMFIHRNNEDVGIADQLVSAIDLRPTVMHMLFPREPSEQPSNPFTGVDILSFRRQAVFSQNLFALEKPNAGSALGLFKSYAATDGDQRLIVTGDLWGDDGGMELYYDPRDPGNTRNFLDFFTLDGNGEMTAFGRRDIIHPHFTMSFKPNLVMSIVNSYNTMRKQLAGFIRSKETAALPRAGGGAKANVFPERCFAKKRRRR